MRGAGEVDEGSYSFRPMHPPPTMAVLADGSDSIGKVVETGTASSMGVWGRLRQGGLLG